MRFGRSIEHRVEYHGTEAMGGSSISRQAPEVVVRPTTVT